MKKILLNQYLKTNRFASVLLLFSVMFSMQSFAIETDCGHISGFEFSNGNSSTAIVNDAEYIIGDLPNNFYVDVIVSGFSESSSIRVKNLDTGQEVTIGENYLPYTFPAGNGAWNYGPGTYEVKSKIFKYNYCEGSSCDTETIRFTLTNTSSCGQIDGLEFSNGNNAVAITNGGSYDLASLPHNFYVDVKVSGMTESAFNRVKNLDTGEVFTNGENVLPYTYPSGNQAWTLGTGTFQFYSEIFKYNNCTGTKCDDISITFTIYEQNCGTIDGLEFSNFSADPTVAIVDGGSYNINNIPSNFNINVITSGSIESAFNTLTNTATGQVYTKLENVLPYTFPGATNQVWTFGCGTFNFCASVYQYDQANGPECDNVCVTFTITGCDEDNCGEISEYEFSNGTDTITIADGGTYDINTLPADFYVDGIVAGESESLRFNVKNLDTNETYTIIENYLPYTFPAGNAAWSLGIGTFEVKGELFSGNYCNSTKCDEKIITFTLNDAPDELCITNAGTTVVDNTVFILAPNLSIPVVNIIPGDDTVLAPGGSYACLLSQGVNKTISFYETGLSIQLVQAGDFNVHLLAYDESTLDLNTIVLGQTTIDDVLNTINNNEICASIDDVGISIVIVNGGADERVANVKIQDTVKELPVVATVEENKPEEIKASSVDIKLYPNPVVNNLNVELLLLDAEVMNYNMYDLNGREVLSGSFDNSTLGKTNVNTEALSTGLYILKFNSNFRSFSKKVQVSK